MDIFLDTTDFDEIEYFVNCGLVNGLTTNPTLMAKSPFGVTKTIDKILKLVSGPVSLEVISTDFDGMLEEGRILSSLAPNVVVKLPLTSPGLLVCHRLWEEDIAVNMTLCFSLSQAILASKAGATYISPFVGRMEDAGGNGVQLVSNILSAYRSNTIETLVLAASIRTIAHVEAMAILGVDVVTLPPKILHEMVKHPMTDQGLETFLEDWEKIPDHENFFASLLQDDEE